jgi:DNA-binding response OmpR family regulator
VARAHRGVIVPESIEGVGTTMTVRLPAADRGAAPGPMVASSEPIAETSPLVLVVDDDDGVREMVTTVLERAGMRVVAADDGATALERFRERPAEFDIVLLDLTMPGVGGDEVLPQLREARPQLPVIIVSGWSTAAHDGRLAELGADEVVTKPFRPSELVATLRRVLARS